MEPIKYFHVEVEAKDAGEFMKVLNETYHGVYYESVVTSQFWLEITDTLREAINDKLKERMVNLVSSDAMPEEEYRALVATFHSREHYIEHSV